jgi:catechol 2,3-dioxygenase-like lactoylglutathione lyase family enzyme
VDVRLTLIVLGCVDLELSRRFYEALGMSFVEEKHGSGPHHYACTLAETVLEL